MQAPFHEGEKRPIPGDIPRANFQFSVDPDRVPWILASLMNQPRIYLYDGGFPEPFTGLTYVAFHNQGKLVLTAQLYVGEEFKERYGPTIGSQQDLFNLTKRYPRHEFTPDGQCLELYNKDDQLYGAIIRPAEDVILIQQGGEAGQLTLSPETPVNNLIIALDGFNSLVQRYVSAIWNTSLETDQKQMRLVLDVPHPPEGAADTYFSTFEIWNSKFGGHPRPIDLEEEIGGYRRVKDATKSLVVDLTDPEASRRRGTQPYRNKFILVTGPEGFGKSLFPKAIDKMLREFYGNQFEHFRLPLSAMLSEYKALTPVIVKTILDHVRENEKKGIPTILHLDGLEQLVPPHQRTKTRISGLLSDTAGYGFVYEAPPPSPVEFSFSRQTLDPIITEIGRFGHEIGSESHHIIVYGESRIPRDELPGDVTRVFRRYFDLEELIPTSDELQQTIKIQIRVSQNFASGRGNPFIPDLESRLTEVAPHAHGLNGQDIQHAIINITDRKKAAKDESPTAPEDLIEELDNIRAKKGLKDNSHEPKDPTRLGPLGQILFKHQS